MVYCIYNYGHFGCFLYSRICKCICSLLEINVQLKDLNLSSYYARYFASCSEAIHTFIFYECRICTVIGGVGSGGW